MSRSRRPRTARPKRPAAGRARRDGTSVESLLKTVLYVIFVLTPSVGWTTAATVQVAPDIRLAIDESAATGTVTVLECGYRKYAGSSREWRYCEGDFVYDATGEEVRVMAYGRADPDDVYAARINAERDEAALRGVKGVLAPLTRAFVGVILLGVTLMGLVFFSSLERWWPFMPVAGAVAVTGVVGTIASMIASNT
ncbi:hypothetical protein ACFFMN_01155 [Planobispora siamensis]|uniref:Uncharacterized protein n=1 Tax=Planobispora siamensis TaxID=936338 RepID=A0A8J3WL41_9ACTN|nr:hypothetical protein [Planobispora siamensis]GIH93423.1 hypothetical protein Psi01_40530 [Planobispora siamensis]